MTLKHIYIGCGNHRMDGFDHVELDLTKTKAKSAPEYIADIRYHLPFKENSAEIVFSRGTLEHLKYPELLNCLTETQRILSTDGRIRFTVPCLDKMIEDYNNKVFQPELIEYDRNFPNEDYLDQFVSRILYHDHYYNHNFETISRALKKTGFKNIKLLKEGEGKHGNHPSVVEAEHGRTQYEIIVEAQKDESFNRLPLTPHELPENKIKRFLARYFNIRIEPYVSRRPMFPTRNWFREKFGANKFKHLTSPWIK